MLTPFLCRISQLGYMLCAYFCYDLHVLSYHFLIKLCFICLCLLSVYRYFHINMKANSNSSLLLHSLIFLKENIIEIVITCRVCDVQTKNVDKSFQWGLTNRIRPLLWTFQTSISSHFKSSISFRLHNTTSVLPSHPVTVTLVFIFKKILNYVTES